MYLSNFCERTELIKYQKEICILVYKMWSERSSSDCFTRGAETPVALAFVRVDISAACLGLKVQSISGELPDFGLCWNLREADSTIGKGMFRVRMGKCTRKSEDKQTKNQVFFSPEGTAQIQQGCLPSSDNLRKQECPVA